MTRRSTSKFQEVKVTLHDYDYVFVTIYYSKPSSETIGHFLTKDEMVQTQAGRELRIRPDSDSSPIALLQRVKILLHDQLEPSAQFNYVIDRQNPIDLTASLVQIMHTKGVFTEIKGPNKIAVSRYKGTYYRAARDGVHKLIDCTRITEPDKKIVYETDLSYLELKTKINDVTVQWYNEVNTKWNDTLKQIEGLIADFKNPRPPSNDSTNSTQETTDLNTILTSYSTLNK